MKGVNYELGPLIKMTAPGQWRNRPISEWPEKKRLFNSVILLFGVWPLDLHKIYFHRIQSNGFQERSSSLSYKQWVHERTILQEGEGCRVKDRVEFHMRLPFMGPVMRPVYLFIFQRRHRRLKRKFGNGV